MAAKSAQTIGLTLYHYVMLASVCVCVCVCVCTQTHTHTHNGEKVFHLDTFASIYTHIHTHTRLLVHKHISKYSYSLSQMSLPRFGSGVYFN